MKITIVGAARSRSTLLLYYLHTLNQHLTNYSEFYTAANHEGNSNLASISEKLLQQDNYIVKIMGHNVAPGFTPNVFHFEKYDQIHLIERNDFFEQACSAHVANTIKMWQIDEQRISLLRQQIQDKNFILSWQSILGQGMNIANYLEMKKYLLENNIPFTLHTYEGAESYSKCQSETIKSGIDYSSIITNYHLKEKINLLFNKCFSYSKAESNLELFSAELAELAPELYSWGG